MLALYGTPVALRPLPTALPTLTEPQINARALAFTFAVAMLSALLVGLVPALGAGRAKANATLARAPRGEGALRRSRTQRVLVVAEVALTLVLLTAAGLMIRSLVRLWDVDPGLNPEDLIVFSTGLSAERAATPDAIRRSIRQLGDRVAMVPGVEAVSVEVGVLPFGAGSTGFGFWPASEAQPRANDLREAVFYLVGPEFLA